MVDTLRAVDLTLSVKMDLVTRNARNQLSIDYGLHWYTSAANHLRLCSLDLTCIRLVAASVKCRAQGVQ